MALYPCPECQSNISEKAKTCPNCGAAWDGVCPECHIFREPSSELCSGCGYPFSSVQDSIDKDSATATNGTKLGKLWLSTWAYFCLPITALVSGIYGGMAIWTSENYPDISRNNQIFYDEEVLWLIGLTLITIAIYLVFVAVGVARRKRWAFQANWVSIYLICLIFLGDFFDSLVKGDAFASQGGSLLFGLLASAIWLVPNHIYWRNREEWFR